MKILSAGQITGPPLGEHLVAVFGVGLVGGAICGELRRAGASVVSEVPINWREPLGVEGAVRQVCGAVQRHPVSRGDDSVCPRLSVVWSAGGAGFQSPVAEHARELEHFKCVLSLGERLAQVAPLWATRFFMVSSAGGLFEGQRNVGLESRPCPLRPYGEFKALQETALGEASALQSAFVYRPSTIYGHALKGRVGLISALLLNGMRRGVSTISGDPTTLRDYVFNLDVGHWIGSEILATGLEGERCTRFLVSGKPSSILEISRLAEELLGRKLYVSYQWAPQNALHNTYSQSIVPDGFRATSLREGMLSVLRGIKNAQG